MALFGVLAPSGCNQVPDGEGAFTDVIPPAAWSNSETSKERSCCAGDLHFFAEGIKQQSHRVATPEFWRKSGFPRGNASNDNRSAAGAPNLVPSSFRAHLL